MSAIKQFLGSALTATGSAAVVGDQLKVTAAATLSDDFESDTVGVIPPGFTAVGTSTPTVKSLDGQKVCEITGTGDIGIITSATYGDGCLETQITATAVNRECRMWQGLSASGSFVGYGVCGNPMGSTGSSIVISQDAGSGLGLTDAVFYADRETAASANWNTANIGGFPLNTAFHKRTRPNGDVDSFLYLGADAYQESPVRQHKHTSGYTHAVPGRIAIGASFYLTIGLVKFWPTLTGGFTLAATPASVTQLNRISVLADLRGCFKRRNSELYEYQIDGGAWAALPDDGVINAACLTSVGVRASSSLLNDMDARKSVTVTAVNIDIEGAWDAVPTAPTSLAVAQTSDTKLTATWVDSVTAGVTRYLVQASTDAGGLSIVDTAWVNPGAQSAVLMGLAPGTTYYVRVYAQGPTGTSSALGPTSQATAAAATPTAPLALAVSSHSASAVGLSWTAPTSGADTYDVYRAAEAATGWGWGALTKINDVPVAGLTYTDNAANSTPDPTSGAVYLYVVEAVKTGVNGPPSNAVVAQLAAGSDTGLDETDRLYALQEALFARINGQLTYNKPVAGSPGSTTSTAVKVFDVPQKDEPMPYAVVGTVDGTKPYSTKTRAGSEIEFLVHVFSEYHGYKEASFIGSQVIDLVTSAVLDLSAAGFVVVTSRLLGTSNSKAGDGKTIERIVRFKFVVMDLVQQVPT